jgi:hypothetical protein
VCGVDSVCGVKCVGLTVCVCDRQCACGVEFSQRPYQLLCQSAPAALVSSARNTVLSHDAHLFDVI